MNKFLGLCGLVVLFASATKADSIVLGSNSLVNTPSDVSEGMGCGVNTNPNGSCGSLGTGPYWDNVSGDGNQKNVGYFLTNSGGFNGTGCATCTPAQFLSSSTDPNAAAPSNIELDHNTSSPDTITLLLNDTIDTSITFGYYNATASNIVGSEVPLFGPGSLAGDIGSTFNLSNLGSGEDYGFYITRNCVGIANCTGSTTWFSNASLDSTDIPQQHFTIFASATTGIYYIGVDDLGDSLGPNIEGIGDYNDIVVQLNTGAPSAVPEPATLGVIGAGILAVVAARRKRAV